MNERSRGILLLLFFVLFYRIQSQSCPVEYDSAINKDIQFQWTSSGKIENEIVFSNPVCYDELNNIAHKFCRRTKWSKPSSPCEYFHEGQQNFVKNKYQPCYFITEPQKWEQCQTPRTNFCPNDTKRAISIWLPYRRLCRFGPIVSMVPGSSYGTPIDKKIQIYNYSSYSPEDLMRYNCLYLNTSTNLIHVDYCESKHHINCTFDEEIINNLCPENCTFNFRQQKCVCRTSTKYCGPQDLWTSGIENPNQKYLLHKLAERRGCYLNRMNDGLQEAINNQFWFYTNRYLDCTFCAPRKNCQGLDLRLTFDEEYKILLLTVYQPRCVYGLGKESYIYCFTDAGDELVKRVKVKEYYHSEPEAFLIIYIVYIVELEKRMGNYWCQAQRTPMTSTTVHSNTVLAYKERSHEFAVQVAVENTCSIGTCIDPDNYALDYQNVTKEIWHIANEYNFHARIMKIRKMNTMSLILTLHMTSNNRTSNCRKEAFNEYKRFTRMLSGLSNDIRVLQFGSSEYCFAENFRGLSWPTVNGDTIATPQEFCLTKDQLPVYRRCVGSFVYGYFWLSIVGQCDFNTPSKHTEQLKEAAQNNISLDSLKHVVNVTKQTSSSLQVIDIYYIAEILSNASLYLNSSIDVVNGTLDIIDGVLDAPPNNIKHAQTMNLTDKIMLLNQDISGNLNLEDKMHLIVKDNLALHTFDPIDSDVSGFVLYNNKSIKNIKLNDEFDNLEDIDDVLLALYIPNEIIDDLVSKNLTNTTITTTVFFNDKFVSSSEKNSSGIVINVNIPPYKAFLPHNLPILFKYDSNDSTNFSCAFWDLGTNFQRKNGDWSDIGGFYSGEFKNNSHLQMCSFSHLTHFGLLVLKESQDLSPLDTTTMNSLTAVGCLLSVIGIAGIFLTAYLFNKWRERTGTQILLHLSTATLLEIVFMYMNGTKLLNCKFAGITLHYVILSKFAWMLVYAFCQYLRFVRVIGPMPNQLVLKSIVFGWGFAVLPVLIVGLADPVTYTNDGTGFCYPNGNSLYYGIYLPISVILIINLFIFIKIFVYLSKKGLSDAKAVQAHQYKLHKRLYILLFFVLGIPWLFGLLANSITIEWVKSIFLLIFSSTSALQGFIMFLFYVILNKETREFWRRSFKRYDISNSEKSTSSGSSISFINFKRN